MKKIGYMLASITLIVIFVPIIILGGMNVKVKGNNGTGGKATFPGVIGQNQESQDSSSGDEQANSTYGEGPEINVYIADQDKIQKMKLEEYILCVVAGEMPAAFNIEALKAQAVASRTFAVTRMKAFGGKGCEKHPDADICTDSAHCQAWISKEARTQSWGAVDAPKYWQKLTDAVNQTKGQILIYNAAPVMYPLFFSTSSGKTENCEDYFSNSVPYLKSVVSPNEEESPKFITNVSFTINEFIDKIYNSKYKIKLDKSKLKAQFTILERTEGGAVKTIQVGEKTLTGKDIREILSLNSANFTFEIGKSDIVFTVTGNGHGVGMSQWGANGMGENGSKYDEILKHYYQGVEIAQINDVYKLK